MKAPVTSGHSSWHRVRKGASTTTLPRSAASETVRPSWLVSVTSWGVGRFRVRPWPGGGAAGAGEPQAATSTLRTARAVTAGARRRRGRGGGDS